MLALSAFRTSKAHCVKIQVSWSGWHSGRQAHGAAGHTAFVVRKEWAVDAGVPGSLTLVLFSLGPQAVK